MDFKKELAGLINQCCKENESDTPDFILAEYMCDALAAYEKATNTREKWYGRESEMEFKAVL
jgi:hypothetical protein